MSELFYLIGGNLVELDMSGCVSLQQKYDRVQTEFIKVVESRDAAIATLRARIAEFEAQLATANERAKRLSDAIAIVMDSRPEDSYENRVLQAALDTKGEE
jgi:hypothetical protein